MKCRRKPRGLGSTGIALQNMAQTDSDLDQDWRPRKIFALHFGNFADSCSYAGDTLLDFRAMSLLVLHPGLFTPEWHLNSDRSCGLQLIPVGQPGVTACVVLDGTLLQSTLYAVGYKNHWKQYEREFNAYSAFIKTSDAS